VEFEKAKERLQSTDRIHLDDRARQMVEVYAPKIGGMELGLGRQSGFLAEIKEEREVLALEMSTDYLWNQATS
jgi:hypothetical protein